MHTAQCVSLTTFLLSIHCVSLWPAKLTELIFMPVAHTHTHLTALFPFSGFYWSKRQWVAVASAGPYASLHLAAERYHTNTPPRSFLQAGCPSCLPTNSVRALKAVALWWISVWHSTGVTINYVGPECAACVSQYFLEMIQKRKCYVYRQMVPLFVSLRVYMILLNLCTKQVITSQKWCSAKI